MTVRELIAELSKQDPDAHVGVTATYVHGWIQDVRGLAIAPDGTVGVDQSDESRIGDEVRLQRVPSGS